MEFPPPSIEEYGAKPRDIYDFMTTFGYDIKLSLRDSLSFEELEKIAIENSGTNILCTTINNKNKYEKSLSKILFSNCNSR